MEKGTSSDTNPLLDELAQVQKLTRELESHVDNPHCKSLVERIRSSIQKVIFFARNTSLERHGLPTGLNSSIDSPRSTSVSPSSGDWDRTFKDQESRSMSKKRKTEAERTTQVRVSAEAPGVEFAGTDGYNWRKYGQKAILGSTHPRGYYRCTHRNSLGCQATKKVQRSDEDPTLVDVTYYGIHTCHDTAQLVHKPEPQKQMMQQNQPQSKDNNQILQHHEEQDPFLSYMQTGLLLNIEGLNSVQDQAPSSYSFLSTPVNLNHPRNIFSSPSMPDNCYMGSPPINISPTTSNTSESNCVLVPPRQMSHSAGGLNLRASEPNFTELIPPATSATDSPMLSMDFMKELGEFDLGLQFGSRDFFPGSL